MDSKGCMFKSDWYVAADNLAESPIGPTTFGQECAHWTCFPCASDYTGVQGLLQSCRPEGLSLECFT